MTVNKLLGALARIVFIFAKKIDPGRDVAVVIDNICSVFLHLAPLSMLRRTFFKFEGKAARSLVKPGPLLTLGQQLPDPRAQMEDLGILGRQVRTEELLRDRRFALPALFHTWLQRPHSLRLISLALLLRAKGRELQRSGQSYLLAAPSN